MSNTVEISRELAERLALPMLRTPEYLFDHRDALDELRALLAAPAIERQAEPIYQVRYLGDGGGGWFDMDKGEFDRDKNHKNYHSRTVFASLPAPVAVMLPDLIDLVKDFASYGESGKVAESYMVERAIACLDKLKELNQI